MTELPEAAPADVGLNEAQLLRLDRHLEGLVAAGALPGTLTLVARRGAVAHVHACGSMDRERALAMREDALFRIYSMTKPVTAAAFMSLFEEGKVQLDEPLAKYIPAFARTGVYKGGALGAFETAPPERAITLRDLLTHVSGLTYWIQNRSPVDAAYRSLNLAAGGVPLSEWAQTVAGLPLEFSPGAAWNYSVATDILGRVIEIAAGAPLDEVFRMRIFDPLGMRDTAFFVPRGEAGRLAACYQRTNDGALLLQDDPMSSPYLTPPAFLSGGGGLVSTLRDYARFAQMLCNGGRLGPARILGRKTLDLMARNHLPGGRDLHDLSISLFSESTMAGIGFGLGFAVTLDPAKSQLPGSPGEFFWGGAASTYFWVDPKEELIVVFMTQLLPSSALNVRRELRALVYAALE